MTTTDRIRSRLTHTMRKHIQILVSRLRVLRATRDTKQQSLYSAD